MIRKLLAILSVTGALFVVSCGKPSTTVIEETAAPPGVLDSSPQLGYPGYPSVADALTPLSITDSSQFGPLTLVGEPISRPLPQTNEVIPNCSGGSLPITNHPALASTNTTSVEWEVGGQFGSGIHIGTPFVPVSIDLSAVLEVADQSVLQQSLQRSETWDLSAAPGEIMTYTLSWEELWQQAYIDVTFANQVTRRITVNYRTGIRSDIVAESMQFCDGSEPSEAAIIPQATPEPQASITPMPVSTSTVEPDETLPYHADWS